MIIERNKNLPGRAIAILSLLLGLTACNSVYVKPNSLDTNQKIFVPRGGYNMKRSVKLAFQNRNYNVHVGRLTKSSESSDIGFETYIVPPDAKYSVSVLSQESVATPPES